MEEARERFFSKVNKTDTCWPWIGYLDKDGYGSYSPLYKYHNTKRTHKLSWFLAGHTVPEGNLIRHKCRNRHCVNPEHLETGTSKDNKADQIRDGTMPKGETIGTSKLTEEQVKEIRAIPRTLNFLQSLADKYNVSVQCIKEVRKFKTWKHLN